MILIPNYNLKKLATSIVAVASLSLVALVPDNPLNHLDDPSYWGVIGYVLVLLTVITLRLFSREPNRERKALTLFLAGMPLIYLANWWRHDGASFWVLFEMLGFLCFSGMAYFSREVLILLSVGIAGHAFWDILHYNQDLYVPNWYVIACAVVDLAVGFYVFTRFQTQPR